MAIAPVPATTVLRKPRLDRAIVREILSVTESNFLLLTFGIDFEEVVDDMEARLFALMMSR